MEGHDVALAARGCPTDEAATIVVTDKLRSALYQAMEAMADGKVLLPDMPDAEPPEEDAA